MKTLSMTSKRYTVALGCCDPPTPVLLTNTNDLRRARRIFSTLKAEETRAGGGGEFELALYEHTPESSPKTFATDKTDEGGAFIYSVIFENSRVLDSFSYMDLLSIGE